MKAIPLHNSQTEYICLFSPETASGTLMVMITDDMLRIGCDDWIWTSQVQWALQQKTKALMCFNYAHVHYTYVNYIHYYIQYLYYLVVLVIYII